MKKLWTSLIIAAGFVVGTSAPTSAYVYNGHRFPGNQAFYYVNLDSFRTCFPSLDANKMLADIQLSASSWHDQTNANFTLVYAGQTGLSGLVNDGVTTVFCNPGVSPEGLLGQTWWTYDGTGYLTGFDVEIWAGTYPQYPYLTSDMPCTSGLYLLDVLIHEFGHGLSFAHSADSNATMFAPTNVCSTKERSLYTDDITAIETVYGTRTAPTPDPTPVPVPGPIPPPSCSSGDAITKTMQNGQVDTWLTARQTEGYVLVSRVKVKNMTTITVRCP